MVDFQSRDTSRGVTDDDEEEDEREDEAEAVEDVEESVEDAEESVYDAEGDAVDDGGEVGETGADGGSETDGATDGEPATAPNETAQPVTDQPGATPDTGHGPAAGGPDPTDEHEDIQDHSEIHDHANGQDHVHGHGDDHAHDHGHDHAHGVDVDLLGVAVVTVSSSRTCENDPSGDVVEALVEAADHEVVTRELIRDDLDGVQNALLRLTGRDDVDVVVTTGGTGVTTDDITVEAATPLFDKKLPGFGELFRLLSYEEVGTKAMASRATAGIADGAAVFCLPGSEDAARLGTEELVVEEMAHLVGLARRDE